MRGIGVDVGGMSVKIGLVDSNGEILDKIVFSTPKDFNGLIINLVDSIKALLKKSSVGLEEISGIGIGCPGVIDANGVVLSSCNLNLDNAPLKKELLKHFKTNIKISNDANVATLAEVKFGSAKGYSNAVMLTIGTGVGGGVVIDGKLFEGGNSTGAELGHCTLIFDGEPCACGRRGCIEQYISASALIRDTKRAMLNNLNSTMWQEVSNNIELVDGKTVFNQAKRGDKTANEVLYRYINYFSHSIMSLNNIFRPEIFVIGGGISAQGDYLINKLTECCESNFYGYKGVSFPKIVTATLFNDAGIVGAYSLVM